MKNIYPFHWQGSEVQMIPANATRVESHVEDRHPIPEAV